MALTQTGGHTPRKYSTAPRGAHPLWSATRRPTRYGMADRSRDRQAGGRARNASGARRLGRRGLRTDTTRPVEGCGLSQGSSQGAWHGPQRG
jgi:hypothetical protein